MAYNALTDYNFLIAMGCFLSAVGLGLSMAVSNVRNAEAVQERLRLRRIQRAERKKRRGW